MKLITVIIATKNEEEFIFSRLKNIQSCSLPNEILLNVAVIDNGSSDSTIQKVLEFKQSSNLEVAVHKLPPIGKCAALFWAFKNIKSDYFLLTDANTVFSRYVLQDFYEAIESSQSQKIVWIGNGLGFPSNSDVSDLDSKFLGSLQERHKIESRVGVFSGANGCCYGLSSELVSNIALLPPTRNDDFVISVYAAASGTILYAQKSYAFEFYSDRVIDLFANKFRDSVGHANALIWILRYVKPRRFAVGVIFFRLVFWLAPLVVALICLFFSKALFLCLLILSIVMKRDLCIKYIALIMGLSLGFFYKAPISWSPNRKLK